MLVGCGSTVTGRAVKAASDAKAGNTAVNPGNFPVKPRPPLGNAGSSTAGALAEARRMGENTILTYQVDPTLINSGILQGPFNNTDLLANWLTDGIATALREHNFIAGFISDGDTETRDPATGLASKELMNTVVRLATPDDATAAVQDVLSKSAVVSLAGTDLSFPTHPVEIPRHPATAAVGYDTAPNSPTVVAYTAHGPFVLAQHAATKGDPQEGANLAAAALDQQLPLIDAFAPTPADQLASLPIDPTGLMAQTIPPEKRDTPTVPGSYGPHAVLAFQDDAARSKATLDAAGVDVVTRSRAGVYRARDAAGATRIVTDFADESLRYHNFKSAGGVGGLPGSRCLDKPLQLEKKNRFWRYCLAAVDRYAIEVSGSHADEVSQIISAQYLMLQAH